MKLGLLECDDVVGRFPGVKGGYREMFACIEGRMDEDAAVAATVRATRQFAKRQRTWFRREPGIRWRHPESERELLMGEIEEFLRAS